MKENNKKDFARIADKNILQIDVLDKKNIADLYDSGAYKVNNLNIAGIVISVKNKYEISSLLELEIKVSSFSEAVSVLGRVAIIEEIKEDKLFDMCIIFEGVKQISQKAVDELLKLSYNTTGINKDRKRVAMNFLLKTGFSRSNRERGWFNIPSIGICKFKNKRR